MADKSANEAADTSLLEGELDVAVCNLYELDESEKTLSVTTDRTLVHLIQKKAEPYWFSLSVMIKSHLAMGMKKF